MTRFIVLVLAVSLVVFFAGCSDKGINSDLSIESLKQDQMQSIQDPEGPPATSYEANLLPTVSETPAHGSASFSYNEDMTELYFYLEAYDLHETREAYIYYKVGDEILAPVARLLANNDQNGGVINDDAGNVSAEGVITAEDLIGYLQDHTLADLFAGMLRGHTKVVIHTAYYPGLPGEIAGTVLPSDD